jgi:hypothetical protein
VKAAIFQYGVMLDEWKRAQQPTEASGAGKTFGRKEMFVESASSGRERLGDCYEVM